MRVIIWWDDGAVAEEPEIIRALAADGYEVRPVRGSEELAEEMPPDPEEPVMVVACLNLAGPVEEYDRRVRDIWESYWPLREDRPVGLTLVTKRGTIFKSLPHPWWAIISPPVDIAMLAGFIRRFEEEMWIPEGREEARRHGAI